jgi:nucleoside-diphosphate-sugar epimerase
VLDIERRIRMDKQAVIVTGSSGLIGSTVCRRLADRYHVFGFDRPDAPNPPPEATNLPVDLTDDASVRGGVDLVRVQGGHTIASVVHLAAYYDFAGGSSPLYEELTVRGTQRMLGAVRGMKVEQFIFSSTMLVHAPSEPGQPIDEGWPVVPKWAYPLSKVNTEGLLRREHGPVPLVILRIAGVYDDQCHSIPIAHQIARIDQEEMTARVFPGSVSHGQAFVHLDDVVEAINLSVERRHRLPPHVTLLIGEDQTLSYDELQHTIARLIHGESFETRRVPKLVAKVGAWAQDAMPGQESFIKPWMIELADDHYELNISRARQMLGWEPRHTLRDTLPRMIDSLKHDRARWYEQNKLDPPR